MALVLPSLSQCRSSLQRIARPLRAAHIDYCAGGSCPSSISAASACSKAGRPLCSAAFQGKGIVVLAGPSGVGKSSLIQRLQLRHPGLFGFSVSATTRDPRAGEEHGVHYMFSSKEAMLRRIAEGHFVEHAEVHGNLYGTSVEAVSGVIESGKVCLLDIDCQGVVQVQNSSLHCDATYIFLKPPALQVLESRLRKRGTETEESIAKRLKNAVSECSFAEENKDRFDLLLVNDDLDTTYRNFEEHLEEACQLTARRERLDL